MERPLRLVAILSFILCAISLRIGAQQPADSQKLPDFPLILEIEKSVDPNDPISPQELALADSVGMPAATFDIIYTASLNGEHHWFFSCSLEYRRLEVTPCTTLPPGRYPALWVHNREVLWILMNGEKGYEARYLDAEINPKNPPAPDDPVQNSGAYQLQPVKPKDKQNVGYPLLIHVYGGTRLRLPDGELPGSTDCSVTSTSVDTAHIHCADSAPIQITRDFVDLDATIDGQHNGDLWCSARWKWSKCSTLPPGFYPARWKDGKQTDLLLLAPKDGGSYEVGFEIKR